MYHTYGDIYAYDIYPTIIHIESIDTVTCITHICVKPRFRHSFGCFFGPQFNVDVAHAGSQHHLSLGRRLGNVN